MKSQELVVARYKENLDWLDDPRLKDFKVTVYDKSGSPAREGAIVLPNEGREAQTFIYHCLVNYDHLADWTIFTQGSPFDHCPDFLERIIQPPGDKFEGFGDWLECNGSGHPHAVLPFKHIADALDINPKGVKYQFVAGACFRVSRSHVHAHPVAYYQKLLQFGHAEWPGLKQWSNQNGANEWDMAHVLERLWSYIFTEA